MGWVKPKEPTKEEMQAEIEGRARLRAEREADRRDFRIQRKKEFVREAYLARCRTVGHMNHVEVAKMCADAFDYIESISE